MTTVELFEVEKFEKPPKNLDTNNVKILKEKIILKERFVLLKLYFYHTTAK